MEQSIQWFRLSLGGWLFVSRFVWAHSESQFANTWLVSVVYTSLGVAAIGVPRLRYANATVALWLFVSAWILPRHADATLWNNVIVSVGMITIALLDHARFNASPRVVQACVKMGPQISNQ